MKTLRNSLLVVALMCGGMISAETYREKATRITNAAVTKTKKLATSTKTSVMAYKKLIAKGAVIVTAAALTKKAADLVLASKPVSNWITSIFIG